MSEFNKKKLLELMAEIAPGRGQAEHESDTDEQFLKNFLPVADYRRALEPNTLLILGGRGGGKTELFRLLAIPSGRKVLVDSLGIRSLPSLEQTTWVAGFGRVPKITRRFPTPETIEAQMQNATNIEWRSFWMGLMVGVILQEADPSLKEPLLVELSGSGLEILEERLSLLSEWFPLVRANIERLNYALDKLDEKLSTIDSWLFVNYDELDRLVPSYTKLATPIRELLAFWLDRWRRWERIRPKIFLRTDLFRKEFLGFPDASKLQAHQVRLEWKHSWLYQLLVKRLANSGSEMVDYLQIVPDLISESQTNLGWTATSNEKPLEDFIEKVIGKYMGSSPKKGITYRWIPNHLQDAGGRIAPRSFLKLFALAAGRRLEQTFEESSPGTALLQPSDLQGALMDTSEDRIRELAEEEYPWLKSLKTSLKDLRVPMKRDKFLEAVQSTVWSDRPDSRPPATKPEEILDY